MLKERLTEAMKAAMRAQEKERLLVIRLMLSACKQIEVDERIVLDDARVLSILTKMLKQRKESIEQYQKAGRADLVAQEEYEIVIIQEFLPEPLSDGDIEQLILSAMAAVGASTIKDLSKVLAILRPQCEGRADLSVIAQKVKEKIQSVGG